MARETGGKLEGNFRREILCLDGEMSDAMTIVSQRASWTATRMVHALKRRLRATGDRQLCAEQKVFSSKGPEEGKWRPDLAVAKRYEQSVKKGTTLWAA